MLFDGNKNGFETHVGFPSGFVLGYQAASIRGRFAGCCAPPASGQAAAPLSVAKDSRRAMWIAMRPSRRVRQCNGTTIPRFDCVVCG
jgi:hypothetical protein